MTTLKGLQRILRKRLPGIDRWQSVKVYPNGDTFVIFWYGPKRKNIHPYESKEIPMCDLKIVADRNRMRLRNKTKSYR